MQVKETSLKGVLEIVPPTVFTDERGIHVELFNKKLYAQSGIELEFIQDNISLSKKNVLRGIHGDRETWKLVSCLYGSFFFVVVNWDENSEQYGKWQSFTLSAADPRQILFPPHFGNGHLILSEQAIFAYKQTTYYNRAAQFSIMWNDPKLNIDWPVKNPLLSKRDQGLQS